MAYKGILVVIKNYGSLPPPGEKLLLCSFALKMGGGGGGGNMSACKKLQKANRTAQ